jgi:hypothetical protein
MSDLQLAAVILGLLVLYVALVKFVFWRMDANRKRDIIQRDEAFCQSQATNFPDITTYDLCLAEQDAWRRELWTRLGREW